MSPAQQRMTIAASVVITTTAALVLLFRWFTFDPAAGLEISMPGGDGRPEGVVIGEQPVNLEGKHEVLGGAPSALPGHWPHFRGPNHDNIAPSPPPLADAWPEGGPPTLWTVEMLGEGHAAPVVWEGRVYVIDYDEEARTDSIRCFSLDDGQEIWRRSYAVPIKRNHGMSRTAPAVTPEALVTMGPRCHVVALEPRDGGFLWGMDLQREYGTVEPLWYTGQCPLVDQGQVVLAPCGTEVLLMGVELTSGEIQWTTPNPEGYNMSHASVMPLRLLGEAMYVYPALGAVVGVSAEAERRGELLWALPWNARVAAPSAVAVGEDQVFVTAGYGYGGLMIRVTRDAQGFAAETVYQHEPKDGLASEQQTPILHNGMLHGIMPKDAGALKGQFVCYSPGGELLWSSGQDTRFGLGPFLLADDKFYILSDDGILTMASAREAGYVPLAQARVLDGHDAWGPIALAENRMLLRDSHTLVCIEVGAGKEGAQS